VWKELDKHKIRGIPTAPQARFTVKYHLVRILVWAGIPNNNNKYGKNAQYWIPDGNLKALNLENSVNTNQISM
jgi:hypothetical protein